ncbi:MAG: response regulator [Deltaproteobacteria bacterium]|nr:MAG: response regulator [Deltaproteobacteria bacterium]
MVETLAPKTILSVDDEPETLELLRQELGDERYRLLHAAEPQAALRAIQKEPPDLVVLEIMMRRHDGLALMERIRDLDGPASEVPIVVATRVGEDPTYFAWTIDLGAAAFLSKPVDARELVRAVYEVLHPGEPLPELEAPSPEPEPLAPAAPREPAAEVSGDLAETPLPEVLKRIHEAGATGVLIAEHERRPTGIQFRNGALVAVSAKPRAESSDAYLVRTERIDERQREAALEALEAAGGSLREILVEMGALSEAEFDAALRERAEERLFETFRWRSGEYRFAAGKRIPARDALEIDTDLARLLLDGVVRASPSETVDAFLQGHASRYALAGDGPAHRAEDFELLSWERSFADTLTGQHTLADFRDASDREKRILYAMWITGFVELGSEPELLLCDMVSAPEPEPAEERREAERSLNAEDWFRKGEALVERRQYMEASEAYGMAAHLDPTEGDYVAHLGYALYLSNPKNEIVRREALEHIARGVKLSPEREKPLLFLGRVFRATGQTKLATKMFRRVLKLKPDCHAAHQELRLVQMRAEKTPEAREKNGAGAGLLGQLFKRLGSS